MSPEMAQAMQEMFASFQLSAKTKREVWAAWNENAEGVEACALKARSLGKRNGTTGGGELVTMIRRREHLLEARPDTPIVTGWRFVRGTHSGTFVRDPEGSDRPPPGYLATVKADAA